MEEEKPVGAVSMNLFDFPKYLTVGMVFQSIYSFEYQIGLEADKHYYPR